jgi:tetratricopeptide (TPR) repeat protein
MKKMPVALLILGLVASPVWAQSKLDKAIEKAYEKLEEDKPDEAVEELTKATKDGGAPAWVALGKLQERLGNLEGAGEAYTQARQVATPAYKPEATAFLANFTLRSGTARDALLLANIAVEAGETATTLAVKARAQMRSEDGPGALETADKAVALDASNALARVARGEALFALGRNADAEAALKKAIQLEPDSALAHSRLARVLLALARPPEAVAAARKATQLDANFGEGFAILGGALIAENLNNWGDAIAQAQLGAFLDPNNPIVQTIVGRIFQANGQGDQAVSAYRRALDADPGFAAARLALIKAELSRGNRDAAFAEAKKAAADMPTSPEIQYLLGEVSARQNDYVAALGYLERAIKGMPGNADAWALLGVVYQANKRIEEAAESYGKAVQLAPQNFSYRSTYGVLLTLSGQHEKAVEELTKVVQTPGYKEEAAWANLGLAYRNMNKPQQSIAAYKKALQINPKQDQAALGLGWAYLFTEEYDLAIAAYEQAVQINPELSGNAYAGIGWSYFFKREVDPAKEFLAKAQKAGSTDTKLAESVAKLDEAYKTGKLLTEEQMAKMREQQKKEYEAQQKIAAANNAVRSRNAAIRARGARDLAAAAGSGAVDHLIYMMQTDASYDVRIAATQALGSLGRAARKAVPNLEGLLAQPPYEAPINATPDQLDNQMKDYDYRKAMQNALGRIRG